MTTTDMVSMILRRQFDALQQAQASGGLPAADALARRLPAVMLWGPPGIGKSAIVRAVAQAAGVDFIDVRLAQREPVDMRGLPVPDPSGEGVRWLVSSEWPRDPNSRGIILFDELSSADRMLQVAAYEFILDRRLGDLYRLPAGWLVVGAGNRAQDRAVAQGMSSALANRFLHLELQADSSTWLRWAKAAGVDDVVRAHIGAHPDQLFQMNTGELERGWASPRSWERLATMRALVRDLPDDVRLQVYAGLVGAPAARAFLHTEQTFTEAGPDLAGVLAGRCPWHPPAAIDDVQAQLSAMVRLLAGAPDRAQALGQFLRAVLQSPVVPASGALTELLQHHPSVALTLHKLPEFAELVRRHGAILSGVTNASEVHQ